MSDEGEILARLESELATEELTAFLAEWITTNVHRVTAFAMVLGTWREHMANGGFSSESIDQALPMMMERLWPDTLNFTFTGVEEADDDDE